MAEAILRGVLSAGVLVAKETVVFEPLAERRDYLSATLGVKCLENNGLVADCERLLLAVKPQVMACVLEQIAALMSADTLVISIAAGVSTSFIAEKLGNKARIVRVMPNTPMLVGAGMSAVCAGARSTEDDISWTQELFAASGKTMVLNESAIDGVTAVSGSGPAYFFYLLEAMIEAGVSEGLSEEQASLLAIQTCLGAARLAQQTGESPQDLRAKVTSPGGTTQRAIETMDGEGVKAGIVKAVKAAAERSRELGT